MDYPGLSGRALKIISLYKRKEEGDLTTERRRQCDDGSRDWSDVCRRWRKPKNTGGHKNLKKARKWFYCSELLEGVQPCQHLNFSQLKLISDFWPL